MFLSNIADSRGCSVGLGLSQDRKLIVGLKSCVDLAIKTGGSGPAPLCFDVSMSLLANMAQSAARVGGDSMSAAANIWHDCGIFKTVPKAAGVKMQTSTLRTLGAIFCIAKFAALSENDEGKKALVVAGILPLLDRPDAGDAVATYMGRQELGMLKMIFSLVKFCDGTRESIKESSDGRGRPSDATRQQMLNAMTESMEGMMGALMDKSEGDASSPKNRTNHYVFNETNNATGYGAAGSTLLNGLYEDPSNRLWPCSNPKCDAIEQPGGPRFKKCGCKAVRYCGRDCQACVISHERL